MYLKRDLCLDYIKNTQSLTVRKETDRCKQMDTKKWANDFIEEVTWMIK